MNYVVFIATDWFLKQLKYSGLPFYMDVVAPRLVKVILPCCFFQNLALGDCDSDSFIVASQPENKAKNRFAILPCEPIIKT